MFLLPVLFVLGVLAVLAAFFAPIPNRALPTAPTLADTNPPEVPAFTLTERNGQAVSADDLKGKVWIASFVFTHCTGPCPSVTGTMARLQADLKLADEADLRLVTFTVDPDRDDPTQLAKYAENFRAHPDRWLFLTGDEEQIHKLLHDGFGVHAAPTTNPMPKPGQEFDHSTRLVLVDKTGHIRGYYDGYPGEHDENGSGFRESMDRLKKDVGLLLNE